MPDGVVVSAGQVGLRGGRRSVVNGLGAGHSARRESGHRGAWRQAEVSGEDGRAGVGDRGPGQDGEASGLSLPTAKLVPVI